MPRLVIGIGNPDRGDDGAGHAVVRLLEGRAPADVVLLRHAGEATALLERLEHAASVDLVDAAVSGTTPGTLRHFDAAAGALPSGLAELSSHGLGLAQAIELARSLGVLPPRCLVHAIEGADFTPGAPLTPPVARAAVALAEQLLHDLAGPSARSGWRRGCPPRRWLDRCPARPRQPEA